MQTFPTRNAGLEFAAYKRLPMIVGAIQILEPFRVESLEGDYAQGKAGDFLVRGVDGEHWIVDQAIFHKTYQLA